MGIERPPLNGPPFYGALRLFDIQTDDEFVQMLMV